MSYEREQDGGRAARKETSSIYEMRWLIANGMKRRRRERGVSAKSVALELGMASYAIHNIEGSSGFLVDVRSAPAPSCSFCGTGIDHCAL